MSGNLPPESLETLTGIRNEERVMPLEVVETTLMRGINNPREAKGLWVLGDLRLITGLPGELTSNVQPVGNY